MLIQRQLNTEVINTRLGLEHKILYHKECGVFHVFREIIKIQPVRRISNQNYFKNTEPELTLDDFYPSGYPL